MLEKSPQTVCKGRSESGDTQHPRLMAKGEQASGKHLRGFAHSLFGLYLVLNTLNMYNTHFKNNLSSVRNYFLNTLAVKACGNTTMRKRAIACKPEEVRVLWFGQARPPSGARGLQRPFAGAHRTGRPGAPDQRLGFMATRLELLRPIGPCVQPELPASD